MLASIDKLIHPRNILSIKYDTMAKLKLEGKRLQFIQLFEGIYGI
jgi:hypothetical protein